MELHSLPEPELKRAVVRGLHALREVRYGVHLGIKLHQGVVEALNNVELGDEGRLAWIEGVDNGVAGNGSAQRGGLRQCGDGPAAGNGRYRRTAEQEVPTVQSGMRAVHGDPLRSTRRRAPGL